MNQIILIDDHAMILKGLASFFESRSWTTGGQFKSLKEVEEFTENFQQKKDTTTVALVDIDLGGETGLDAIKLLTDIGIKSIIYSMFSSSSYVIRAIETGAKGYVSKSASEEELMKAVEAVAKCEVYIQQDLVPAFMFSASIFSSLTSKEKAIVECIKMHKDNQQIADELGITRRTVENHLNRIYDKFGVQNKHQLEEKL